MVRPQSILFQVARTIFNFPVHWFLRSGAINFATAVNVLLSRIESPEYRPYPWVVGGQVVTGFELIQPVFRYDSLPSCMNWGCQRTTVVRLIFCLCFCLTLGFGLGSTASKLQLMWVRGTWCTVVWKIGAIRVLQNHTGHKHGANGSPSLDP